MLKLTFILLVLFLIAMPAGADVQILEAWWIDTGETDSTKLGSACAPLGDVNSDGLADFLVGTINEEAFVYLGSEEPDTVPRMRIPSPDSSVFLFGGNLYNIGDINMDGGEDFAINAWISDIPVDHLIVYVYFGGGILDSIPDLVLDGGENSSSYFGFFGAGIGDFNGDGGNDFIILDSEYFISSSPVQIQGRICVYYGGAILDSIPDWEIHAGDPFTQIGEDAAGLGDVNDDGYDDFVMVDSYCYGPLGEEKMGVVAVYHGGIEPDTSADIVIYGEEEFALLGRSVSGIDFNLDDQTDIVVGSGRDFPPNHSSSIYVYLVSESMSGQPDYIFPDEGAAGFGTGSGIFGMDINGDGWHDIVSANPMNTFMAGQVYVYLGGANPDTLLDAEYYQGYIDAVLGSGACNAGDINGDLIDDLIIGEQGYNQFYTGNIWGRLHVILGDTVIHQSVGIIPEEYPQAPASHLLLEAYPNPFNAQVTFKVGSLRAEKTTLRIYNLKGEVVLAFELGNGINKITWDGTSDMGTACTSGIYLARVVEGQGTLTQKIVFLK